MNVSIGKVVGCALSCVVLSGSGYSFAHAQTQAPIDPKPRVAYRYSSDMRFGVYVIRDTQGKPLQKRLTFSQSGSTNDFAILIDGKEVNRGKWLAKNEKLPPDPLWEAQQGSKWVWKAENISFTQIVQLVPGKQPVEVSKGVKKRLLDTVLARYVIKNEDSKPHEVGLRLQLDTLIGSNDGVPFLAPGLPKLVTEKADLRKPEEIPDFIQALEKPDLKNPGTVAHLTLKPGGTVEPPSRVSLTHWQGSEPWEYPVANIGSDSAVVLYWNPQKLKPNETREIGFAYGLGSFASQSGRLGVTVAGSFYKGEEISVTAYVMSPKKGQTVSLELPSELELVEGKREQTVTTEDKVQTGVATWKIKPHKSGEFQVIIDSGPDASVKKDVTVMPGEIIQATPGDTIVNLRWPEPEAMEIEGYRVYRAGDERPIHGDQLVKVPFFRDIGLSNGQSYTYIVRAVLPGGNEWAGYRPVTAAPKRGRLQARQADY